MIEMWPCRWTTLLHDSVPHLVVKLPVDRAAAKRLLLADVGHMIGAYSKNGLKNNRSNMSSVRFTDPQ